MKLAFYIAKRYLFAKKSQNVITVISRISVVGVAIGSLALVVVLSAFNGLQNLVESLYASFDPDIRITATLGKSFSYDSFPSEKIKKIKGVKYITKTIEETALLKFEDKQTLATIKGVENEFTKMSGLDSMMVEGNLVLKDADNEFCVLGYGIANALQMKFNGFSKPIWIYVPKRSKSVSFNPDQAFHKRNILTAGIFSVNPDFDNKYILVPFEFAAQLLQLENKATAVEIGSEKNVDLESLKNEIQSIVGANYTVQTRYQINELIYKTNKTEKWVTFLILTFILIIAAFNIISSLTMLIIDKTKDIWILKCLGASKNLIRLIFFTEGIFINLLGALTGIVIGTVICLLQQHVGLLRLEGSIVEYYPVHIVPIDFLYIFITVFSIGLFASWYPVRVLTKKYHIIGKN
ncbi:MAG: FtsX-like permease family protein [Flavobacteriales bacterium]|nr:FtsX-like permease family protein [Flavobacteriales bacterium]